MTKKALTLSIVIPVYNEQSHLGPCLDSIVAQTVKPLEVIVVDNNSTDRSVAIAQSYNFVKVVYEKRQGRGYARSRGFNEARGDILGRINAEAILAPNWTELIVSSFKDPTLLGLTGLGRANVLPRNKKVYGTLWSRLYFWTVHSYFNVLTMWGANMALRRDVWLKVKNRACLDDDKVHEDQDLSILIAGLDGVIRQNNNLMVTTGGQHYHYLPKFLYYAKLAVATKHYHRAKGTLAKARKTGRLKTLPGGIIGWTMAIIFSLGSMALWPIDSLMVGLKKHSWLD